MCVSVAAKVITFSLISLIGIRDAEWRIDSGDRPRGCL